MNRRRALVAVVVLLLVAALVKFVLPVWLWHPIGMCTGDRLHVQECRGYSFWSGIAGSGIADLSVWGAIGIWWWHSRCSNPRCFRKGRYPTSDGMHHLCGRCHPDMPDHRPSLAEIHAAHHAAKH